MIFNELTPNIMVYWNDNVNIDVFLNEKNPETVEKNQPMCDFEEPQTINFKMQCLLSSHFSVLVSLPTTTWSVLPQWKDLDHPHVSESIPYIFSMCTTLVCETFSKTLVKSITTTSLCLPFSMPLSKSLVNLINWVSVESLHLKPCWWLYKILF